MLRIIFVFGIIAVGVFYSFQGPFYALLFYLWNAYFRPEYWIWNDFLYGMRLSLTIGAFLLISALPAIQRIRFSRQLVLVLLFLAHSGVSLFFSEHVDRATVYWIEFMKIIVITALMTILVDSVKRFRLTVLVIAFSLGFEAAKQGWAQFVLNPGATNNNPHLMLGDNNGVAMGMMMLIPLFMALSQTTANRWERYIDRFFIVGVVYRGISTYSRGGFLAAALVGAVSLWRSKHKIRTVVMVVVVAWAISSVMPQQFWDRMESITASEGERDSSSASRIYFWRLATQMASDHPFLGVGFNSYRFSFDRYDVTDGAYGGSRTVHSSWFGVLSELGYPGFLLFIAILVGAVLKCHRIRVQARRNNLTDIATFATHMQTSVLVFMLGGTFLSAQYLELMWHMVGLTIALENIHARTMADLAAGAQAVVPATVPVEGPPAGSAVPTIPGAERPRAAAGGRRRYFG